MTLRSAISSATFWSENDIVKLFLVVTTVLSHEALRHRSITTCIKRKRLRPAYLESKWQPVAIARASHSTFPLEQNARFLVSALAPERNLQYRCE